MDVKSHIVFTYFTPQQKHIYRAYKYVVKQPQLLIYFENKSIFWLMINESYSFIAEGFCSPVGVICIHNANGMNL